MYLKKIAIKNIGPISELNIKLPFTEDGNPKPIIFVGENGAGKTIMLSQIIDSFYEISGTVFSNIKVSKGMGYSYFKISGGSITAGKDKGFSALQFEEGSDIIEYLDKSGEIKNEDTECIEGFKLSPKTKENEKQITNINDSIKKSLEDSWHNGVYFYQPAYRYEEPFWKVDDFKNKVIFEDTQIYSGELGKEIEIISSLNKNKSFLMDLVLDQNIYKEDKRHTILWNNINTILRDVKQNDNVRFGIGQRGNTRVSVVKIDNEKEPQSALSLDNLSLGESVLLNLFINIIRHSCQYQSKSLNDIVGIVAIDEIDIHLHTNLQSKVLPKLIKKFPKVQFIITSHSPLFLLGMEREFGIDGVEIRNMPNGELITTERFVEFENAYNVLKKTVTYENEIQEQIKNSHKPLVFVEGDYDKKYIKKAAELLEKSDIIDKIEFIDADGYKNLNKIWGNKTIFLKTISEKILLLYDCDTNIEENSKDKIFKRIIPYMKENYFDRGIENLFPESTIQKVIEKEKTYIDITDETKRIVRGKEVTEPKKYVINSNEKGNLCTWLCTNGNQNDFKNFDKVFEIFEEFLQ